MKDWTKASKDEIEDEFYRELDTMCKNDMFDIVMGLISDKNKKDFVIQWHGDDEE